MRVLLTSSGVKEPVLARELADLCPRPVAEATAVFIPTAANVEAEDKSWLIDDLVSLKQLGFACLDIVDVEAMDREHWQPRLAAADVIVVGGGSTPHLLNALDDTGAGAFIADRVRSGQCLYVGISAGSILAGREPLREFSVLPYDGPLAACLGLADLVFLPHLNSPEFPARTKQAVTAHAAGITNVYACDDRSGLRIIDDHPTPIGPGECYRPNATACQHQFPPT